MIWEGTGNSFQPSEGRPSNLTPVRCSLMPFRRPRLAAQRFYKPAIRAIGIERIGLVDGDPKRQIERFSRLDHVLLFRGSPRHRPRMGWPTNRP